MFIGVISALLAAFSWTAASFIWRSEAQYFDAIQINFAKNFIAAIVFLPFIVSITWPVNIDFIIILLISGIIGIALGDSFYISALKRLGSRRTLTLDSFSPVLANLLGVLIIGESLPFKAWVGTSLVTISLLILSREKIADRNGVEQLPNSKLRGFLYTFLYMLCAVIAGILSRFVLLNSDMTPFHTAGIRLLGSLIVLVPFVKNNIYNLNKNFHGMSIQRKIYFLLATLLGTNLGIFFQQTVFKLLPIGIGWTLLSSSPVISILFSRFEGDKINQNSLLITLLCFAGVAITLL